MKRLLAQVHYSLASTGSVFIGSSQCFCMFTVLTSHQLPLQRGKSLIDPEIRDMNIGEEGSGRCARSGPPLLTSLPHIVQVLLSYPDG